jgi:hypothetical protein
MRCRLAVGAFALSFVMGLAEPVRGEPPPIDTERSTITVRVFKSGLFRAFADDHVVRAPIAEGSIDDSTTASVQLAIDAGRLQVLDPGLAEKDRNEVQARMLGPEVLDAERFARIAFRATTVEVLGPDRWLVHGEIELHGRVRPIALKVSREGDHYRGSTQLRQSEFGIKPISIAGGAVKVKDEVTIEFDAVAAGE